ncbi:MAG: GNAT family N-acetyltransferase [Chloroflexaceae bacterium]|nr:GNAT family N-acetyltransferase [Chloroflexaceae bacterium]
MKTTTIVPLPADDYLPFARIVANAFPVNEMDTAESLERFRQRLETMATDAGTCVYGCYRNGRLVGGMRLFDFTMHVFGARLACGGLGLVSVDLAAKKQGVAKDMVRWYLRHYHERGTPLAALYPFRPDFYKQMGFGYGTPLMQYRLKPAAFPNAPERRQVRLLTHDDKEALAACYERVFKKTHGLFRKRPVEVSAIFDTPQNRVVGYEENGLLRGYFVFQFRRGKTMIANDIEIRELVYETPAALAGLSGFINSQADQVQTVILNTHDDDLFYMLSDVRNDSGDLLPHAYHVSHTVGVGLMYRVLDVAALFEALKGHDFNGANCRLKLTLRDSFFPERAGSTVLHFNAGRVQVGGTGHDVELRLDVSEFSSLVLGVTTLQALYTYRLAELSDDAYLSTLSRLFRAEKRPVCCTRF